MTDTKTKRAKRRVDAAAKERPKADKKLKRWQRQALNPEIKRTDVILMCDEQGDIWAVPLRQFQQDVEQLKAGGSKAVDEYLQKAAIVRRKNKLLLHKRASEAISCLFAWAVATKWCDYNEPLSPDDQREMLNVFYAEAAEGIKRAEFRRAESDVVTKAYIFAKPLLLRFRKILKIPNERPLNDKEGREIWAKIAAKPRWAALVEKHAMASMARRAKKGEQKPIAQMKKASNQALRSAVNARWKRDYGGEK